jgi:hypothetical protein
MRYTNPITGNHANGDDGHLHPAPAERVPHNGVSIHRRNRFRPD